MGCAAFFTTSARPFFPQAHRYDFVSYLAEDCAMVGRAAGSPCCLP